MMEVTADRDVATGQLSTFKFNEPKEQFELEEDFEGNAQEILLENQLQDLNEIDQILAKVEDPFGEVSEDEETDDYNRQVSHKFLVELKDMKLQQQEDQALKERQMAEASRLADEQQKAQ